MIPHGLLVVAGALSVWHPADIHPWSAVVLAVVGLLLVPWAWQRTSVTGFRAVLVIVCAWVVFLGVGQAGGWDRSEALTEIFLLSGLLAIMWFASREAPSTRSVEVFSVVVAALAVWGMTQSWGGLEQIRPQIEALPEHLRAGALARVEQRRAFASLLLPSHLAVVLATALPILIARIRSDVWGWMCGGVALIACAGIVATRSPVGGALAVLACGGVMLSAKRRFRMWVVAVLGLAALAAAGLRPDVVSLEPLALRFDNWSAALWAWSKAPVVGVGLGGFGQAAQAVPWAVGNRPLHAHCLPLEWLAELGVVGALTWVLLFWLLLKHVGRLWPKSPGLAAALLVVPVHNLVDFSFYSSGVLFPWGLLLGWSLAMVRNPAERSPDRVPERLRILPVVVATVFLAFALLSLTSHYLVAAAEGYGPPEARLDWAYKAAALAPWSGMPVEAVGMIAFEMGDRSHARDAAEFVRRRSWQRPRSASRAHLEARLYQYAGDPVACLGQLWRAAALQPHEPRRQRAFEEAQAQMLEVTRHRQ